MRLPLRSSTVAAIALGSTARSIASGQGRSASASRVAENDQWSHDGMECILAAATAWADSEVVRAAETRPDVGLLAGCHPLRQACVPDESSSLGGRCRDKVGRQHRQARQQQRRQQQQQQQQQQQTPRFLEEFVCPATCPEELCDCAATTYYGFPDAQDCAFEVHAVCLTGDVADCFDADYPDFYSYAYCPLAECWLAGNSDDDACLCGYYRDYCDLYGGYADGYPEVAEKCAAAACCEGSCPRDDAPLRSTRTSGAAAPTNPPVRWLPVVTGSSEDEDRSDRFSNDGAILNVTGSSTEDPAPEEGGDPPAGSPTGDSPEDAVPPSVSFTKAASESGGAGRPRTTAGRSAATALLVAAGVWLCA